MEKVSIVARAAAPSSESSIERTFGLGEEHPADASRAFGSQTSHSAPAVALSFQSTRQVRKLRTLSVSAEPEPTLPVVSLAASAPATVSIESKDVSPSIFCSLDERQLTRRISLKMWNPTTGADASANTFSGVFEASQSASVVAAAAAAVAASVAAAAQLSRPVRSLRGSPAVCTAASAPAIASSGPNFVSRSIFRLFDDY